jgi:ElaB/YqjD/DUF883 family membrane-anchored ribosome-binding protein
MRSPIIFQAMTTLYRQALNPTQENYMDTNSTSNTLSRASSSAHDAVSSAANSIAGAADDIANKAKPTIDRVAAMAHQAVDKAASATAPGAEWLSEKGESLRTTKKKLMADTCDYVSANPLKSLGIAVATGFFVSLLVRK